VTAKASLRAFGTGDGAMIWKSPIMSRSKSSRAVKPEIAACMSLLLTQSGHRRFGFAVMHHAASAW